MIKSFRCRDTQAIFEGRASKRFSAIARVAERKLQMLDNACSIEDLKAPPGNRLESLFGDRKGEWSIRINDQWRVCFRFAEGGAFNVAIIDYN